MTRASNDPNIQVAFQVPGLRDYEDLVEPQAIFSAARNNLDVLMAAYAAVQRIMVRLHSLAHDFASAGSNSRQLPDGGYQASLDLNRRYQIVVASYKHGHTVSPALWHSKRAINSEFARVTAEPDGMAEEGFDSVLLRRLQALLSAKICGHSLALVESEVETHRNFLGDYAEEAGLPRTRGLFAIEQNLGASLVSRWAAGSMLSISMCASL